MDDAIFEKKRAEKKLESAKEEIRILHVELEKERTKEEDTLE